MLIAVSLTLTLHVFAYRVGADRLEVTARDFRVMNSRRETLFAANRREVVVGADILRVSGTTPSIGHFIVLRLEAVKKFNSLNIKFQRLAD